MIKNKNKNKNKESENEGEKKNNCIWSELIVLRHLLLDNNFDDLIIV